MKICLILPYFGKFNNYFPLWLESCRHNPNINWFIFTDDKSIYSFPNNIHVKYCSFKDIQLLIHQIFGTNVLINTPYDLCKYRVVYHKLFPKIICEYDYWGYCDCDVIWGDLESFLRPVIKVGYKKIHWRGHLTLFKNSKDIQDLYSLEIAGNTTFKAGISMNRNKRCNHFDEVGINRIFDHLGIPIYKDLPIADLKVKSRNFYCYHYSQAEEYKNKQQIFEWKEGHLFRWFIDKKGELQKEEFAYIHFLRREMRNCVSSKSLGHYLIIPPNKFVDYQPITWNFIMKTTQKKVYWEYYQKRLNLKRFWNAIKHKIHDNSKLPDEYLYIIK